MRRATVRTDHGDERVARTVAAALGPDNTDEMDTRVDGTVVETTVDRGTTGGLHATVDDYVVNLHVAAQLAHQPDAPAGASGPIDRHDTDTTTDT